MNSSFKREYNQLVEAVKVTSEDLIKETSYAVWCSMPTDDTHGITCKRILTPDENHGFLLRYETGARTGMHVNTEEYESLNVRQGSITNIITNQTYTEGDTVVFDKDEIHEIECGEEAFVYYVMSKSKSKLG